MAEFRISKKKEFLVTYPCDYLGMLVISMIVALFTQNNDWLYIISCEEGHERGHIHLHFHVYLKYKGKNKGGFSKRGKNASRVWDIKLPRGVYRYIEKNDKNEDEYHYSFTNIPNSEYYTSAHPNIKFKGDKDPDWVEKCKDTLSMMKYVTKQTQTTPKELWKIESNFEWEEEIKKLENMPKLIMKFYRLDKDGEKIIESRSDNLEYCFTSWLRNQLTSTTKSIDEIKNEIMNDDDLFYIYSKRKNNWNSVIAEFCKIRDSEKPKPNWDRKYILPRLLYDFIQYLDNWVKQFYQAETDEKGFKLNLPERPKGLWLTGKSRSGKTSLCTTLGSFSYFNNMWNLLNYSYNNSYNLMDDYKGTMDTEEFTSIKGWIGAQYTFTVSDKFIKKVNIVNGKPLIWLSNKPLNKQVTDEDDRDYVRKNMTVIELGDYDLYTPKDTRSIGGYTNWIEWDPKSTWYYNNIINIQPNEPSTSTTEETEPIAQLLPDPSSEITLPHEKILGRPKRTPTVEIQIPTTGNKRRRI